MIEGTICLGKTQTKSSANHHALSAFIDQAMPLLMD